MKMAQLSELNHMYDLIEYQAETNGQKPYILCDDAVISFDEFNRYTLKVANGMVAQGGKPGHGVALFMGNCPEYLYLFHGLPRTGMYSIPINTALKGDGLRYILKHSDAKYLVADDALYSRIADLGDDIGGIEKIFIRKTSDSYQIPGKCINLNELFNSSSEKLDYTFDPESITYLMYTSGTTGFPKGVVNRLKSQNIQGAIALASFQVMPEDVLFTALPLFHANALIITATLSLAAGVPFGLEKSFSASGFWDQIRKYGATQFNAIGAMIPILMKQPEKPDDADNPVRLVISAACPTSLWEAFEKRFGLKIWEAYGAVDGGGVLIMNFGHAPVGSIGNGQLIGTDWRIVDDEKNDVETGDIGELLTLAKGGKSGGVEYYKNKEASEKKCSDGWVNTGDLFFADKDKNLYFVDRKTDSIRRRGENISSFEVENILEKHPDVDICAAFGVPSELGEDEVMVWIKPTNGNALNFKNLIGYCADTMAYFMVPRFIDIVDDIPRTGTLRVQKTIMKQQGVTAVTWDREKEMPGLQLKK